MSTSEFVLVPISTEEADALRTLGGAIYVADDKPGYPCRQCLRDAEIGEELILVSHDPFTRETPYRSPSPIFLHLNQCTPYVEWGGLPDQLTVRQLSVRSFDDEELMIDAAVIDGTDLDSTIERFLSSADSAKIHIHNANRGCWAVSVGRR